MLCDPVLTEMTTGMLQDITVQTRSQQNEQRQTQNEALSQENDYTIKIVFFILPILKQNHISMKNKRTADENISCLESNEVLE